MLRINNNNNKVLIISLTFSNNSYFVLHPPCDGINLSSPASPLRTCIEATAWKTFQEFQNDCSPGSRNTAPPSRSTPFSRKLKPATSSHHFTTDPISQGAHSYMGTLNVASGMHWPLKVSDFLFEGHIHTRYTNNTNIKCEKHEKTIQLWIKHLFSEWCWEKYLNPYVFFW